MVEMVVALSLLASALLIGTQMYAVGTRVRTSIDDSLSRLHRDRAARALLVDWLRRPLPAAGFTGEDRHWSGLSDDRIVFWVHGATPADPGLRRVELYVDRDEVTEVRGLVAAISATGKEASFIELSPEATSLDATYSGEGAPGPGSLPIWRSESRVPFSVVLEIGTTLGSSPLVSGKWIVAGASSR